MFEASRIMINLARLCVLICFAAHTLALLVSGADAASSPISQLSRGDLAWVHGVGLLALGISWIVIAAFYWRGPERGILWRVGCLLLVASALLMPYIAVYFATASDAQLFGPDANDPLAVLASTLGIAMGALQAGLRRQNELLGRLNLVVLILWLALIPVIPFIEASWLGTYERTVGILMLLWTLLLLALPAHPKA